MTKQIKKSWTNIVAVMAVATAAALLGVGVAPTSAHAAAAVIDGYTCYGYDVCTPGSSTCCFEVPWILPGDGRCSTVC